MQVKATAKFTNFINNLFKAAGNGYRATLDKLTPEEYERIVDYNAIFHENDYNYKTNTFQAIRITYPADLYAIDKYITTNELIKIFRRSDHTATDFFKKLMDEIEV